MSCVLSLSQIGYCFQKNSGGSFGIVPILRFRHFFRFHRVRLKLQECGKPFSKQRVMETNGKIKLKTTSLARKNRKTHHYCSLQQSKQKTLRNWRIVFCKKAINCFEVCEIKKKKNWKVFIRIGRFLYQIS